MRYILILFLFPAVITAQVDGRQQVKKADSLLVTNPIGAVPNSYLFDVLSAINSAGGDGNGIFSGSGSLLSNTTVTGGGNTFIFRNVPTFTVELDNAFSESMTLNVDGLDVYHNDGGDNFATLSTGMDGQGRGRFQHVINGASSKNSTIEHNLSSTRGEHGLLVAVETAATSSTDVNLLFGENWSEEGLQVSEGAAGNQSFATHYVHMNLSTADSTFALFDDALLFDYEQVPSTTSGDTTLMAWVGDGTNAAPLALNKKELRTRKHGFTSYTSDPSATLSPKHGQVYYFDTTTAGWTQVFSASNLEVGDSFYCYFLSTDTNSFTLDKDTGGFIRPNANGDILADATEVISTLGYIELTYDGTDFVVFE